MSFLRLFVLGCLLATLLLLVSGRPNHHPKKNDFDTQLEKAHKLLKMLYQSFEEGLLSEEEYVKGKENVLYHLIGAPETSNKPNISNSIAVQFLLNQMVLGLPRSYQDTLPNGQIYWHTVDYLAIGAVDPFGNHLPLDSQVAIQERTLSHYGLNLYDGATWEIALSLSGLSSVAGVYERNVLYTSSTGENPQLTGIPDIRGDTSTYKYGAQQIAGNELTLVTLPGNATRIPVVNGVPSGSPSHQIPGASFYRMVGPTYQMTDVFDGNYANSWKYPWPNNDNTTTWNTFGEIHWNDWKPITGENVWATMIGPLQTLWLTNGTNITEFTTFDDAPGAVQLALSILPALKALQSPLGSLYHCPKGTDMFPPDPDEATNVSNENNFSSYAALTMLYQLLLNKTQGTSDPILTSAIETVDTLLTGLEKWFSNYLLSPEGVIFQGGHVSFAGDFEPNYIVQPGGFAVDCQTWGMTVLGQPRIDGWWGEGTAYKIWQTTKEVAGFFIDGKLAGVGYTNNTFINGTKPWSAEWTFGAINMARKLAYEYQQAGNSAYATDLLNDAQSMLDSLNQPAQRATNGTWIGGGLVQEDGSYLYCNTRFFIPWGWYANPIGSTCSTSWSIMAANNFNPFVFGGGVVSPFNNSLTYRHF